MTVVRSPARDKMKKQNKNTVFYVDLYFKICIEKYALMFSTHSSKHPTF